MSCLIYKSRKRELNLLPEDNKPKEKEDKGRYLNLNFNYKGLKFRGIPISFRYLFYGIFISLLVISNSQTSSAPYITFITKSAYNIRIQILNSIFKQYGKYQLCPKKLYINGAENINTYTNKDCTQYNLHAREKNKDKIYTIKIVFTQVVKQMTSMFEGLDLILEVDLSHYYFTTVTKIDYLFKG